MKTLYRIENQTTNLGLWYSTKGVRTDWIKNIENAKAGQAPMDFDPNFTGFLSAGITIPQMRDWFFDDDLIALGNAGYQLFEVQVPTYKLGNGHALFKREGAIYTPASFSLIIGD